MMLSFVLWLQTQVHEVSWWTGDQIRTVLMTLLTTCAGFIARLLYTLRDEVRDLKRDLREVKKDIHGVDGSNGIKSDVRLLVQRVDVLEDWKIAQIAVAETERRQYHGPDRRAGPRRMSEVVDEGHREKMRRVTDEYSSGGE